MRLNEPLSSRLIDCLNRRSLSGYLRVAQATPWANMEEALEQADVDEMSPEAISAFLNLQEGGEKGVGTYEDSTLAEYFGEYSLTAKSFRITGGRSMAFKDVKVTCRS
jgi:hypothetical protein